MAKKEKRDFVEIDIGFLKKATKNPWALASVFLALIVLVLLFARTGNGGVSSESEVAERTLNFLSSQVGGEVILNSIEREEGYYEMVVSYQGEQVPLQVTLDGNYLISDLVPIS